MTVTSTAPTPDPHWTESFRSMVRPTTTFAVLGAYIVISAIAIYSLIENGLEHSKDEYVKTGLALFAGLSGVATTIIGFWFGSRGSGGVNRPDTPQSSEQPDADTGEATYTSGKTATAEVLEGLRAGATVSLSTPLLEAEIQGAIKARGGINGTATRGIEVAATLVDHKDIVISGAGSWNSDLSTFELLFTAATVDGKQTTLKPQLVYRFDPTTTRQVPTSEVIKLMPA